MNTTDEVPAKRKRVKRKDSKHYVDNERFYVELTAYIKDCERCALENLDKPRVPEYIGECILAIANKLSNSPNFMNYAFKDDMISDGVINALQYITNFDYVKYTNPFAYYTQIIWYAFVRRIKSEKTYLYVKMKSIQNTLMEYDHDLIQTNKYGSEYTDSNMNEFIDVFEKTNNLITNLEEKRKKLKAAKLKRKHLSDSKKKKTISTILELIS